MNMENFFREGVLKDLMAALEDHDFETRVKPKIIKVEVESVGAHPMKMEKEAEGGPEGEEGKEGEEMLVDLENYGEKAGSSEEELDPRLAKRLKQLMG